MKILDFMGEHPILTFFLAITFAGMVTGIAEAIMRVPT